MPAGRAEMALDPFAHHGLGDGPHVELGIERARHAFDHHHGLLQQQQLGPRAHVEQAGDLEQQHQQLRHRDFVGGAVVDRLADRADRLRERLDRMVRRHIAGLEMHLGGALVVAGDEAVQDFGEEAALLRAEPAHDAEVDERSVAPSSSTNRLPGCMSAWKKPSRSAWRRKVWITARARCLRSKPLASSLARSCSGVPSIQSSVSTSLAVRSQSTAGTRKSGSRLGVLRHLGQRRGLEPQVHLDRDRAAQRRDGLHQAQPPRLGDSASARRAANVKASRSTRKRCSMLGRSTLTATGLRPAGVSISARCTCAIEAAATAGPNVGERFAERLAERCRRPPPRPRGAGTAPSCPAGFRDRGRARCRPRPAASPGTGRA